MGWKGGYCFEMLKKKKKKAQLKYCGSRKEKVANSLEELRKASYLSWVLKSKKGFAIQEEREHSRQMEGHV